MKRRTRVAVGMSGGLDSSVAALLLRQAGYEVIGLTMQIWGGGPDLTSRKGNACYGPGEAEDLKSVERIAAQLKIPHYPISLSQEYQTSVLDWFCDRYLAGVTPNPCAVCNPIMKFGRLVDRALAQGIEFDYFATGHYVRRLTPPSAGSAYRLLKGVDPGKDQSYFLARLKQDQLARSLFPLGEMTKVEIRELARDLGLNDLVEQAESQDFFEGEDPGVLFPPGSIRPGPIIDLSGRRLGTHRGIIYYTVGQRQGLGVAAGRKVYVKEIDAATNTIVLADREQVTSRSCRVIDASWISGIPPEPGRTVNIRLRYRHEGTTGQITPIADKVWNVEFAQSQFAVTPGQMAVFYAGDEVLGGGWIERPQTT